MVFFSMFLCDVSDYSGYSVRGAYLFLTNIEHHGRSIFWVLIWHKKVHFNVSLISWRLLCDHLSTKVFHKSQLCVFGCGAIEMVHHLIFGCNFSALFGIKLVNGLVFRLWILFKYLIILFNLVNQQASLNLGIRFCS